MIFQNKHLSQTEIETACKPMKHPPSRQSDRLLTTEINDPSSKGVLQDKPGHSKAGKNTLRSNPDPKFSET